MQLINTFAFTIFLFLVVVGGLRTGMRVIEYRRAKRPVPVLLIRDVLSRNGLAISFVLILLVRALDIGPLVRDQLWWTALTALPAIFGAAVYAYFEFFIIDKRAGDIFDRRHSLRDGGLEDLHRKIDFLRVTTEASSFSSLQAASAARDALNRIESAMERIETSGTRNGLVGDDTNHIANRAGLVGDDTNNVAHQVHQKINHAG
jgi:hypothetical protein